MKTNWLVEDNPSLVLKKICPAVRPPRSNQEGLRKSSTVSALGLSRSFNALPPVLRRKTGPLGNGESLPMTIQSATPNEGVNLAFSAKLTHIRESMNLNRKLCKPFVKPAALRESSAQSESSQNAQVVGKRCGTPIHTQKIGFRKLLKKVPTQADLKVKAYFAFTNQLRLSNGLSLPATESHYKFYVGPGNNSHMVKRVLRKRWWWTLSDSAEQSHLVWTSAKHQGVLDSLPEASEPQVRTIAAGCCRVSQHQQAALGYTLISDSAHFRALKEQIGASRMAKLHNRLDKHKQISNKKYLFRNLTDYCVRLGIDVHQYLPVTFHLKHGLKDPAFVDFVGYFHDEKYRSVNNVWIVKPGEETNRGVGIRVTNSIQEVKDIVTAGNNAHTYIVQKYITNPLLIHKRKFDIRCFALVSSINGVIQAYFYQDGYIRTSGHEFNLIYPFDKFVHLTNDAIQKDSDTYGKFEEGNKWSYAELQAYLTDKKLGLDFTAEVVPKMREAITLSIQATFNKLNPQRKAHCFEVFGYDFMVDETKHVWLIEANTNPCLEQSSHYLATLLPAMIDNAFRIVLDPLFPPPAQSKQLANWLSCSTIENKFELIFSEAV